MLDFDKNGRVKLPKTFESVTQLLKEVVDDKGNINADKYSDALQSIAISYQGALLYQSHTLDNGVTVAQLSDEEKKLVFDQQDTLIKFAKTILTMDTSVRVAKALALIDDMDDDTEKIKYVRFLDKIYGNQLIKAAQASEQEWSLIAAEKILENKIKRELTARKAWFIKTWAGANTSMGKGVPDILVCYRGRFLSIEVKRPDHRGRITRMQKIHAKRISDNGGVATFVSSMQTLSLILDYLDGKITEITPATKLLCHCGLSKEPDVESHELLEGIW